jgi:hypothetical protein
LLVAGLLLAEQLTQPQPAVLRDQGFEVAIEQLFGIGGRLHAEEGLHGTIVNANRVAALRATDVGRALRRGGGGRRLRLQPAQLLL